jgi:hypothetical protein
VQNRIISKILTNKVKGYLAPATILIEIRNNVLKKR